MAIDKIKPLKMESSLTGGTENDVFPTEADPNEDYIACKGISLENNSSLIIDLDNSGNIRFTDATEVTPKTVRQLRTAIENLFSNVGNGFTSSNVQSAIEEARNSPFGKIISFTAIRAGSASNSFLYLGDSGVTTDGTPFVVPTSGRIIGITATSNSGSRNYDVRLNVSVNTGGSAINRTIIYQIRNTRNYSLMNWSGVDSAYNLDQGDKITIYCQNQGSPPSDLSVTVYYQFRSNTNVAISENYNSNLSTTVGSTTVIA